MGIDITGQVALISGASRGIGAECAYALAREGCRLALVATNQDKLLEVAAHCTELGAEVLTIRCDVRRRDELIQAVADTIGRFGALNILVNNAGLWNPGSVVEADLDAWDDMLDVNLRAAMQLTRLSLPHIIAGSEGKAGRGAVIFVASMSGLRTYPGGAGYCATKFGEVGFAKAVFDDVRGHNIKVSSVCPGWVNTDMAADSGLDGMQMIQPEDVAELVRLVAAWPDTSCPKLFELVPQKLVDMDS